MRQAIVTLVQFTTRVIDTQTGKAQAHFSPLNATAAPVQDTSAFPACP